MYVGYTVFSVSSNNVDPSLLCATTFIREKPLLQIIHFKGLQLTKNTHSNKKKIKGIRKKKNKDDLVCKEPDKSSHGFFLLIILKIW